MTKSNQAYDLPRNAWLGDEVELARNGLFLLSNNSYSDKVRKRRKAECFSMEELTKFFSFKQDWITQHVSTVM